MARPLEEGARVRLIGLRAKNGLTGILVQKFADGKWKVKLDDGSGNALLRANYLEMIAEPERSAGGKATPVPLPAPKPEEIDDFDAQSTAAADLRRSKIEERRAQLKEKLAAKKQANPGSLLRAAALEAPGAVKRRDFLIVGSWDGFVPRSMTWDEAAGHYAVQLQIGSSGSESFQIFLDRSGSAILHPGDTKEGEPGLCYNLQGPDPKWKCDSHMWIIGKESGPGAKYEIQLHVTSSGHWDKLEWTKISAAQLLQQSSTKVGSAVREVSTTPPGSTAQDDVDSPSGSAAEC